jgi:hypothetical protein
MEVTCPFALRSRRDLSMVEWTTFTSELSWRKRVTLNPLKN